MKSKLSKYSQTCLWILTPFTFQKILSTILPPLLPLLGLWQKCVVFLLTFSLPYLSNINHFLFESCCHFPLLRVLSSPLLTILILLCFALFSFIRSLSVAFNLYLFFNVYIFSSQPYNPATVIFLLSVKC